LVAAVVVGALSAFLVFNYVQGADERAQDGTAMVNVLKLTAEIKAGQSAAEVLESIASESIPKRDLAATAITDTNRIAGKVAKADWPANTQLVEGMFVDPAQSSASNAGVIPDSCGPDKVLDQCVAMTMSFDRVHGVAGLINPGDRVNILMVPAVGKAPSDLCMLVDDTARMEKFGEAGRQAIFQVDGLNPVDLLTCTPAGYLYQSVQVLFVDKVSATVATDQSGAPVDTAAGDSGMITFVVPPKAAAILASFADNELYLTLLPDTYEPAPIPALDPTNALMPGQDGKLLTPYGPSGFPDS
jgi:Flp pilus assembly protein CpaB